jgi:hypothetical protein
MVMATLVTVIYALTDGCPTSSAGSDADGVLVPNACPPIGSCHTPGTS